MWRGVRGGRGRQSKWGIKPRGGGGSKMRRHHGKQSNTRTCMLKCIWTLPSHNRHWFRRSRPEVLYNKNVLRNFTKFTSKQRQWRPANLLKKEIYSKCFTENFVKFFVTAILENVRGWLLLTASKKLAWAWPGIKTYTRSLQLFLTKMTSTLYSITSLVCLSLTLTLGCNPTNACSLKYDVH